MNLPKILEIDGKRFKKVNLNTEFSVRASQYAKVLVTKIIQDLGKIEETKNVNLFLDMDFSVDALALMYIELDENNFAAKFTEMQYQRQREFILDSTINLEEHTEDIADFINFFMKRLNINSLILSKAGAAASPKPKARAKS